MAVRSMSRFQTGLARVAPDVHAYLQYDGGWGIGNAGFLDTPDGVLVVDALFVPSMTLPFIRALRGVTQRPVRHLVNTHFHGDHTNGNQFMGAQEVVGHVRCREEMVEFDALPFEEVRAARPWLKEEWAKEIVTLTRRFPELTFTDRLSLHYGRLGVEVMHFGPAHTFGDAVVHIPERDMAFIGDLGFFDCTPLARGSVLNFLASIDKVLALGVKTMVPGHGPVGGAEDLRVTRSYLQAVAEHGEKAFAAGLTPKEAARQIDLGPFRVWSESERIEENLVTLYRDLGAA